jgi:chitinase
LRLHLLGARSLNVFYSKHTGLAKHALIGYWHNFTNPAGPTFHIKDVSSSWDVIVVAFADNAGSSNVGFTLDPAAGTEAQLSSALNYVTRNTNCATLHMNANQPNFRGVMTWSINWDKHDGFNFSVPVKSALNSLP